VEREARNKKRFPLHTPRSIFKNRVEASQPVQTCFYQSGQSYEGSGAFLEKGCPASANLKSSHLKIDIETKFNLI
jgi:hypothetical protein